MRNKTILIVLIFSLIFFIIAALSNLYSNKLSRILECWNQEVDYSNYPADVKHDIFLLKDILPQLRGNAEEFVPRCEELLTQNGKEICYTTYVSIKISVTEKINSSICQKILDTEAKKKCIENT